MQVLYQRLASGISFNVSNVPSAPFTKLLIAIFTYVSLARPGILGIVGVSVKSLYDTNAGTSVKSLYDPRIVQFLMHKLKGLDVM